MEELKRLNKYIGETGYCSRREADDLIEQGRVTVDGAPALMGMKVSDDSEVRIDGKLIRERNQKPVYLALHKPAGIECTTNREVKDNIVDFVNYPTRLFPIGRLDKASEGLIFMTNDGDIVNKILRARNNHEKEYLVTVDKPVSSRFVERMSKGVPILDTVTRECFVEATGKFTFRIILTQGLNRQIRRMCEYLGYEVKRLVRVRIINIKLDLPLGRHRELTEAEIAELQALIEPSSKTEEASLPKGETPRATIRPRTERSSASKDEKPTRKPYDKRQREDAPPRSIGLIKRDDTKWTERKPTEDFAAKRDTKIADAPDEKPEPAPKRVRKVERIVPEATEQSAPIPTPEAVEKPKRAKKTSEPADEAPSEKPAGKSRWKIEHISKDDPNYRQKGEY